LANMEELNKKIKELEDRISQLETRRILQQDILPQVIKSRHLDSVEMGLYFDTENKRIGIGGTGQYLYRGNTGEIRIANTLIVDGDMIAVGSTYGLRIYTAAIPLVFGDSAGGYDTNLYRVSANTLATDDDMKFMTATKGPIIIDRATATVYRIKSTNGTLGVEAV